MVRFDSYEECRCLCIDRINTFFRRIPDNIETIRKTDSFIKTYKYFRNAGFLVEGYIDRRLLVTPKFVWYIIAYHVSYNIRFFDDMDEETAILYYSSAYEIYHIHEEWTHCICEFYKNQESIIFDSFYEYLKIDYPSVEIPTHDSLKSKIIIALKVRRAKY